MQKTVAEVRQFKDVINPIMKDIELRLKTLEMTSGDQASDDKLQMMSQHYSHRSLLPLWNPLEDHRRKEGPS